MSRKSYQIDSNFAWFIGLEAFPRYVPTQEQILVENKDPVYCNALRKWRENEIAEPPKIIKPDEIAEPPKIIKPDEIAEPPKIIQPDFDEEDD